MAPRPPPKRSGLDKKRPGLDDMTLLTKPTPQGIRDNLKERLEAECIYTYIGNVLVAANPFTWLQIYSSDDAKRYMRQSRLDVPPHVFAVAEAAFRAMTEEEDSQCVIISGESGAGKTEASKHIQGYFALCSQGNSAEVERVKKVFLESNPLLEAFGNAKTLRNNNSSRFVAACVEIKILRAFDRRVDLHAIDATPARWRSGGGRGPLDSVSTTASSPWNVHLTHWLISTGEVLRTALRPLRHAEGRRRDELFVGEKSDGKTRPRRAELSRFLSTRARCAARRAF